jgi:hypothetical protein
VTCEDDEEATRDWLLLALKDRPKGLSELVEQWLEDEDYVTDEQRARAKERLRKALGRMARDGEAISPGRQRGDAATWSLRWAS